MRHSMQCLLVAIATSLPVTAAAQDQVEKPANPFEMEEAEGGYGPTAGGYPGGGYPKKVPRASGAGGEAYPGAGGASPYGEGSPYGGGGASPYGGRPDPFRAGLARLLDMLPKAKSEEEKKQLLEYAREALTKRYQQQLENREREIRNLELRLTALRDEQQRRSDAAERIIELQMKSLELAAEGLLERDQVINISPRRQRTGASPYGGGGSPYGGEFPYGGGSPYGGSPMMAAGGYGEEGGGDAGEPAASGEPAADAEPSDDEQE